MGNVFVNQSNCFSLQNIDGMSFPEEHDDEYLSKGLFNLNC